MFIGFPGRSEGADQRTAPVIPRLPRARPGRDTDVLGAGCTENIAANCSERHRSADRYSTTLPLPRDARAVTRPPDARRRYHDRKVYRRMSASAEIGVAPMPSTCASALGGGR